MARHEEEGAENAVEPTEHKAISPRAATENVNEEQNE